MWGKLLLIWKSEDLRKSILKVLGLLIVFRIAAHIPMPGVDVTGLKDFFSSNAILGLANIFSGGTLESFSIAALGVGPYITASIIFQLLGMIVPKIEEIQKDGEAGQKKINQWTRILTVPLAFLQAYGMIALLRQSAGLLGDLDAPRLLLTMTIMTAGSIFLMWLGEIITEEKVGNGISIMIFAAIIAAVPTQLQQAILTYDSTQLFTYLAFAVITLITVAGVVILTEGQRNIPVNYAKHMRGGTMTGGVTSHLPLRVSLAGVIPIIFAISLILFPPMIAQFFVNAKSQFVANAANWTIAIFQDQLFYGISYFVLVFFFTFFYTAIVFKPDQIAENLQKQGGYVPGIRPGNPTADYLGYVMNRIVLVGALGIGFIAILPIIVQQFLTGSHTLVVGGASLLIIVAVVLEIVRQVESRITMREYEDIR